MTRSFIMCKAIPVIDRGCAELFPVKCDYGLHIKK
jgi:hypothetical protein